MKNEDNRPKLSFEDQTAMERWLEAHHADSEGIWLILAKKGSGIPTVSYKEAVEAALCYGWIDGQAAQIDDKTYMQKFMPRRQKSIWSKINRERAMALIEAGRMRPAGQKQVDEARADGRWEAAYASPSQIAVPEDLQQALDANPAAKEFFAGLNGANRYAVLYRVETAKKPETRAARIEKLVAMLARREKIHPTN